MGAYLSPKTISLQKQLAARKRGRYVRSIPYVWATRACQVGGKGGAMALALYYRAGVSRSKTVKLLPSLLKEFGVGRTAAVRLLRQFESAGLIRVTRTPNRVPVVVIVDVT